MIRGKFAFLMLSVLPILASTSAHARTQRNTVYVDVKFKKPRITRSEYSPQCKHIDMESAKSFGRVGEPVLPIKGLKVLIPPNTKVKSIEIIPGEKVTLPGFYLIEPGQKQYPISKIGKMKITPDKPNFQIYHSDTPYFKGLHTALSSQKKMGYSIASIVLYPVEYNPLKGTIAYYKTMQVAVNVEAESKVLTIEEKRAVPRLRPISWTKGIQGKDQKLVQRLIDNKEDLGVYDQELITLASSKSKIPPLSTAFDPSMQYKYVIITRSDFVSSLEPLKERRTQKGLTATIVTTEWIFANYPGTRPDGKTDDHTKIRNFITDAYNNWGTEYVLLAGDGDGADVSGESGNNIIPARGLSDPAGNSSYYADNNIPADLYYSCLDGSFDKNANGIYGDMTDGENNGEVDLLAEVYVGRICIDSVTEAENFVKKTLAYEDSDNHLTNKNYMVGEYMGWGGVSNYATESMEEIRLGTNTHDYETTGFISNPNLAMDTDTLYDNENSSWPKSQLIDIINNGVHILNHLGHSMIDYNMKLYNSDVDALANTDYFVAYSQGCYPGSFDNRTTDPGIYSGSDCIVEHLTGNATGAVAFVGNSRYGWGRYYSTAGSSQYYNRQFWDALFSEGITQIGKMNQDSKEDNIPYLYSDMNRWCYFELNLFGDPALEIHTTNTTILTVTSYSFIGSAGDRTGHLYSGGTGELITTVKALNQDAINASITLSSTDPCVSIEHNNSSSAVILKGTFQENSSNPFKFTVSKDCPMGHTINFELKITADGYYKELALSVEVYDPKIFQIAKNTAKSRPAISGDKIAWVDSRNYGSDIYIYDLSTHTERQSTASTAYQRATSPAISGDKIVWVDHRHSSGGDIYLYDLSTDIERRITNNTGGIVYVPDISENKIVWVDSRNGNKDLFLYDLSTDTERQITTSTADQSISFPAISGNKIVWETTSNGSSNIYLYDLSTDTERQITDNPAGEFIFFPSISEDRIVWVDFHNQHEDIYLYDLSTNNIRKITSSTADQAPGYPAISGDKIVWIDFRKGSQDVYFYDLSTNTARKITTSMADQSIEYPAISGDKIVWMNTHNSKADIFLYDLK